MYSSLECAFVIEPAPNKYAAFSLSRAMKYGRSVLNDTTSESYGGGGARKKRKLN